MVPLQMGFGQVSMVVGNVLWNVVTAQGRVRLATFVEIITSWCFVVPLSAISVFIFNFNLVGTVAALVVGYSIGGIWISYIVLTSDWKLQSEILIERHGSHALPYNDYTWDSLPNRASRAAELLGCTKNSWDENRGRSIKTSNTWDELNEEEKAAARCLGYNKTTWERDKSDSSINETLPIYDDSCWKELPLHIQAAAVLLGYNQAIWDEDKIPCSRDKGWYQLNPDEQEAAQTLGYTEETWNDELSTCSSSQDDSVPTSPEDLMTLFPSRSCSGSSSCQKKPTVARRVGQSKSNRIAASQGGTVLASPEDLMTLFPSRSGSDSSFRSKKLSAAQQRVSQSKSNRIAASHDGPVLASPEDVVMLFPSWSGSDSSSRTKKPTMVLRASQSKAKRVAVDQCGRLIPLG